MSDSHDQMLASEVARELKTTHLTPRYVLAWGLRSNGRRQDEKAPAAFGGVPGQGLWYVLGTMHPDSFNVTREG